jgi:hypothetical protein
VRAKIKNQMKNMMYLIYAVILLQKCGKEITVENMRKVLDAAHASYNLNEVQKVVDSMQELSIASLIERFETKSHALLTEKTSNLVLSQESLQKDFIINTTPDPNVEAGLASLFGDEIAEDSKKILNSK